MFSHSKLFLIVLNAINNVMPAKAGIQTSSRRKTGTSSKLLDSPVSSTGQAQSRASLEFIRRMLDGMTKKER